jgi:hypothetical protein
LSLIPYMPLSSFKFKRPETGAKDDTTLDLSSTLTLTPYLELLRKRYPRVPPLDASFDVKFEYDMTTGAMQPTGGMFKLKVFQGIGLSAGTVSSISPFPEITPTAEGGFAITEARLPKPEPLKTAPGFQIMINVDLANLKGLPGRLDEFFKAFR